MPSSRSACSSGRRMCGTPSPSAEQLREAAPDRLSEANVSTSLGALAALEGRFDDARALCIHARATYDDIGSTRALNGVWSTMALLVERRAGDLDAAAEIARDATRYFEQQGDRAHASTWAARLAELLYWSEQYEEARRSVAAAREGAVAHDVYVQFLWRSTAAKLAAREDRAEEADLPEHGGATARRSERLAAAARRSVARARRGPPARRTTSRGSRGSRARTHAPEGEGRRGRGR